MPLHWYFSVDHDKIFSRHSTLKSWPILRFLPPDLADEVVQALVFGETGNEALVAIASGDVYALGFNKNGCLGIGNTSTTYEPRKLDALCRKGLVDIAYSIGPSILVLTGKMFIALSSRFVFCLSKV